MHTNDYSQVSQVNFSCLTGTKNHDKPPKHYSPCNCWIRCGSPGRKCYIYCFGNSLLFKRLSQIVTSKLSGRSCMNVFMMGIDLSTSTHLNFLDDYLNTRNIHKLKKLKQMVQTLTCRFQEHIERYWQILTLQLHNGVLVWPDITTCFFLNTFS